MDPKSRRGEPCKVADAGRRSRKARLVTLLAGLVAAATLSTPAAGSSAAVAAPQSDTHAQQWLVTLITGHKVEVTRDDGGRYSATVVSGIGSAEVFNTPGHLYVLPMEAAPLFGSVLDRSLFDVRTLVEEGFDDAQTASVPVLVSQAGAPNAARLEASTDGGLDARRVHPRTGLVSATVSKARASSLGAQLVDRADGPSRASGNGTGLAGVTRMWLDRKIKVSWDRNLEQVGAPAAWSAGYDGRGVKVAVLDTGIDTAHPDFAGQVITSQDFTGKGSVADGHGHGTHVAGLVAGRGAGNPGLRKGVAAGASLLVGKVMADDGTGPTSGILAGMEWAVAQGADVVNMSLGGASTDGTDALSQAVNRLTGQGTLFVVSAGNSGPGPSTLGAPGVADAALTVAAVDADDKVTDFSSRGPRADGALKPDVAAPGARIAAARAAGTAMGTPVDDLYTAASGTSMSAPQVAGAAAVLLQRHPDWTPAQVKAALAGTADLTSGATPDQVGAGRIDLAEALTATVVPEDEDVDLGSLTFPHTEPKTATVSWRNVAATPVRLNLAMDVRGAAGTPVSEQVARLSAPSVTVPAGGTGQVTLTVDAAKAPADRYAGYLTATIDGTAEQVQTPVGFSVEAERYDLTARFIDRSGQPTTAASFHAVKVDGEEFVIITSNVGDDGTLKARVPAGTYFLSARISDRRLAPDLLEVDAISRVVISETSITADREVVFDARTSEPVATTIAGKSTAVASVAMYYARFDHRGYEWWSQGNLDPNVPHYVPGELEPSSVGSLATALTWRHIEPPVRMWAGGDRRRPVRTTLADSRNRPAVSGRLQVVDVGGGTAAEFAGRDLTGKIALVRRGQPVPAMAERAGKAGAAMLAVTNDRPGFFAVVQAWPASAAPTVIVDGQDAGALRAAARAGTVTVSSTPNTRYSYDLHQRKAESFPGSKAYTADELRRLAAVETTYAHGSGYLDTSRRFERFGSSVTDSVVPGTRRVEYVTPGYEVLNHTMLQPRPRQLVSGASHRTFRPDEQATATWFGAPLRTRIGSSAMAPIARKKDRLEVVMHGLSDGDENLYGVRTLDGGPGISNKISLYRDGTLVDTANASGKAFTLPPENARYRLVNEYAAGPLSPLGTRTTTQWEFASARSDEPATVLPLPEIDYDVSVDVRGRMVGREIGVNVVPQPQLDRVEVDDVSVRYSTDDGTTWHELATKPGSGNRVKAKLPNVKPGTVVSLQVRTHTKSGVDLTETVVRAVQVS